MNIDDAVRTVAEKGFTERQARFLVLVARHSGVCVMRQYSTFAGIVFGQKTRKFFAKLTRLGYVSTYDCAHNRARIYHLRHRDIYEAIGEADSRLRRPPAVPRAPATPVSRRCTMFGNQHFPGSIQLALCALLETSAVSRVTVHRSEVE